MQPAMFASSLKVVTIADTRGRADGVCGSRAGIRISAPSVSERSAC